MNTSPNRLVALATPLVFAPLAGAITALAAKHAPGLDIDQGQLEAVFIAGATIAFAKSGLWLKGWQDYEQREQAGQAAAVEVADDPYAGADDAYDEQRYEEDVDVDVEFEDEVAADFDDAIEDDEHDDVLVAKAG